MHSAERTDRASRRRPRFGGTLAPRARPVLPAAVLALGLLAGGCTPKQYAAQADRAAYRVIAQKQDLALGKKRPFNITYNPLKPAAQAQAKDPMLLNGKPIPVGDAKPRVLSLDECLQVAVRNSRSYQTRKEGLYSSALALAGLRRTWSDVDGSLAGTAGWTAVQKSAPTTKSGTGSAALSFARKFAQGGMMTLAAGLDVATNFLDIRDTTFGSLIEANLTQPLWRGAWRDFAYEPLYRAERDLAYSILEYERFTQSFAVGIATDYYGVLRQRDQLSNDEENLRRLELTFKLFQAQMAGGMIRRVQADRAEQDVLKARARIQTSTQAYRNAVDQFKLTLGLPIAASIELDQGELYRLKPMPVPFDRQQAIDVALRTRPDVLIQRATVRDAGRDVEIAADAFNPRLDLSLGISARGTQPRSPFRVMTHRHTRFARLNFNYDLDQRDNRDSYRNTLIGLDKAQRDLDAFLDNIVLDVRRSFRSLTESKNSYEIQKAAVALGKRWATLAKEEQKEGLVSTREVLEAEDALRASKNAMTSALVNYTTTRLSFLAKLGMISVDQQGKFHERTKPEYFDRSVPPAAGR